MTASPIQDSLKQLRANGMDWVDMQVAAKRARSHTWFKNMAERGAWGDAGTSRVGPPDPDAFDGLAALLGTSREQVGAMVAAEFYGVDSGSGYSARIQRLAPKFDALSDEDAEFVSELVTRLGRS